jgi:hypothetical protein
MSHTTARPRPSPTTSVDSVKSGQHQVCATAAAKTDRVQTPATTTGPDLLSVLMLCVVAAVVVRVFWKAVINVVLIGGLALVFAGVFGMAWMTGQH